MKAAFICISCSVLLLLQLTAADAATVVLQEDFEGSSYVVGNDPTAGSIPLIIDKRVHVANRTTEGVYGTDATVKIVAPTVAGFGSKSLEAEDFSFTYMFDLALSSTALRDYNGGNGVQKGTVQFDFVPTLIADAATYWYMELNLVDDYDLATSPLRDDQLVNIKNNNGTFRCRLSDAAGTQVNRDSPTAIVSGSAYRFIATFDVATRVVTVELQGPLPAVTSLFTATEYIYSQPTAASPFKGVRGLHVNLSLDDKDRIQIDNLIVTDTAVAGVGDWLQF